MTDPAGLTADDFEPLVGAVFAQVGSGGATELRLVDVRRSGRRSEHREAFRLLFAGPPIPYLPQDTYRLRHDGLGELDIFLVPVGREGDGFRYEAVFT